MGNNELSALRDHMATVPTGPVNEVAEIQARLFDAWDELEGSDDGGMSAYKLLGRVEDVCWEPPTLSFTLERHGGAVLGSVNAELQPWSVDIDNGKASCGVGGKRVVGKRQKPLDIGHIVNEIVDLVVSGKDDTRLKWADDKSRVLIVIGKVLPDDGVPKQTSQGRRNRFARRIREELLKHGWHAVPDRHHAFERI